MHAHGSTDKLPYVTMGSGSLAAMAVFESSYKEHLSVGSRIEFASAGRPLDLALSSLR